MYIISENGVLCTITFSVPVVSFCLSEILLFHQFASSSQLEHQISAHQIYKSVRVHNYFHVTIPGA